MKFFPKSHAKSLSELRLTLRCLLQVLATGSSLQTHLCTPLSYLVSQRTSYLIAQGKTWCNNCPAVWQKNKHLCKGEEYHIQSHLFKLFPLFQQHFIFCTSFQSRNHGTLFQIVSFDQACFLLFVNLPLEGICLFCQLPLACMEEFITQNLPGPR